MQHRALIVAEDENIRRLLDIKLRRAGFMVEQSASSEEAAGVFADLTPDVIVIDDSLPGPDAAGLATTASRQPAVIRPLVVVLSSQEDDTAMVTAIESGADVYIVKPFSPRDVIHRIREGLLRCEQSAARESGQ